MRTAELFGMHDSGDVAGRGRKKPNPLLAIVAVSMKACGQQLPAYGHRKSKHTFTQTQLMSCLVLKTYLKQTYRGIVQLLEVSEPLREAMGLKSIPAHTTLKMFADRVASPAVVDQIVGQVLADVQKSSGITVNELAVDSTGVECSAASRHYQLRTGRKRGRYVKLMIAVACGSMLAVSASASMGPNNDIADCWQALWSAGGRVRPNSAYLDSGFDGERVHQFFRDGMNCASFIPPVVRTRDGTVKTKHRSRCVRLPKSYGRRWNIESFISGTKSVCGSVVRSRLEPAMLSEEMLKVLAYAIWR